MLRLHIKQIKPYQTHSILLICAIVFCLQPNSVKNTLITIRNYTVADLLPLVILYYCNCAHVFVYLKILLNNPKLMDISVSYSKLKPTEQAKENSFL